MLVLTAVLGGHSSGLLLPRLLDSAIGCAIILVAGHLLWPESWHARLGNRLARAMDDAAEYVHRSFAGHGSDPGAVHVARARQRRRLYRDLSEVRTEFQRALSEPGATGTRAAAWWPLVVTLERIVDATTAARVHVRHGGAPPGTAEARAIEGDLRQIAARLRVRGTADDPPAPPAGVSAEQLGDTLRPLGLEVAAAYTLASSRRLRNSVVPSRR